MAPFTLAGRPLAGIVPPVLTPFDTAGDVDVDSLRSLARHLIGAGVHGLFGCGSSAEIALLDDEQRELVIRTLVEVAAGRVPVLAGVIDAGTRRVVSHARHAQDLGADAVVATAPYYVDTHDSEVRRHFEALASAIEVPVIAYDIPSTVHRSLPAALTIALARDGVVRGIKDSSGDLINFRQVIEGTADLPFSVLMGNEPLVDVALFLGAHGAVPSLGNVDPGGFVELHAAALSGDWATARRIQARLNRLKQLTVEPDLGRIGGFAALVGSMKHVLAERDVIASDATAFPFLPLADADREAVDSLVQQVGI